jgi:hypothetical protein
MPSIYPPARRPRRLPGQPRIAVRVAAADLANTTWQRRAEGSWPSVRQLIRELGYQLPIRHRAATGKGTIEHGKAPAGEGL